MGQERPQYNEKGNSEMFLASQLIYTMQSISLPEKVLTNANRLCYKFIWQKRFSNRKEFEKIKRVIMLYLPHCILLPLLF